jgi:hypothetical protein
VIFHNIALANHPETDGEHFRALMESARNGVETLERERNEEMGYRGQWCDKARKAEAALDALEDLTRELAATKKTLGTLIAWSVVELGEYNTQRLLDMMSPENVEVMAHPLARANVDRGVEVKIRCEHGKQWG